MNLTLLLSSPARALAGMKRCIGGEETQESLTYVALLPVLKTPFRAPFCQLWDLNDSFLSQKFLCFFSLNGQRANVMLSHK